MKQDVVIFSMFKWSSNLMHREHMIAKTLQKMGYKVYFIERTYFNPSHIFKPRISSRNEQGVEVITLSSLPYMKGKLPSVYKMNDRILGASLKKMLDSMSSNAWLIVSTPNWARAVIKNRKRTQVLAYDMSDDLSAFATNEKWRKQLESRERELLKKADIVFVTAKKLLDKTKECKTVYLVENGVDLTSFERAKPVLKGQFKKPIAGYIGGIYKWVDLGLIQKAATLNPEIDFVLVGPTDRKSEIDKLTKLKNVHYLGEVKWQEIGDYFASLDIGLIPFVSEEKYPRLKTVNSNKVFQYSYFGYPIISTDFTQVRDLDKTVTVCKKESDFLDSLSKSLNKDNHQDGSDRVAYAKSHSWENQVGMIVSKFRLCLLG